MGETTLYSQMVMVVAIAAFGVGWIELMLKNRWSHGYFKTGITAFSTNVKIRVGSLSCVNFDLLSASLRGRVVRSVEFHRFSDTEYGFSYQRKSSLNGMSQNYSGMRGFIKADTHSGVVEIHGHMGYIFALSPLVLLTMFLSIQDSENTLTQIAAFTVVACVLIGVVIYQRYHFAKLAEEIASAIEKSHTTA